jgi:hypothetical protein
MGPRHFHIASMPKLDLGAGVSLGYDVVNASSEVSGTSSSFGTTSLAAASASSVVFGVFGLVRYFVTDPSRCAASWVTGSRVSFRGHARERKE